MGLCDAAAAAASGGGGWGVFAYERDGISSCRYFGVLAGDVTSSVAAAVFVEGGIKKFKRLFCPITRPRQNSDTTLLIYLL